MAIGQRSWWACSIFPDLNHDQLPDQRFMFSILSILRLNDLQKMISNARKYRAT